MIFTRLGQVIAVLLIIYGIFRIWMGMSYMGDPNAARYLGNTSPGVAIDRGVLGIIAGIVIGVLTDISRFAAAYSGSDDSQK